jgi:tetratricopeptide (TPR) repeat protein
MVHSKGKIKLFGLILLMIFGACSRRPGMDGEKIREYANALYNRELYTQAVREYQRYLDIIPLDEEKQANVNFIIANIYFERLHDYENAMAYYLKVKHVFPKSALTGEADKQIIACLERMQRSADAKQALEEATSLNPDELIKSRPGDIVAKIGNREITSGDLSFHISQLPDYIQSQLKERTARLQFLKQYIATELFYDAAKRQALDKDKDVIEGTYQAKKSLMVQKYLENEIADDVEVKPDDVKLFYDANKENYAEKDDKGNIKRQKPFKEVQQQVTQDLMQSRQQKAYEQLLDRMVEAEDVRIFEDKVK